MRVCCSKLPSEAPPCPCDGITLALLGILWGLHGTLVNGLLGLYTCSLDLYGPYCGLFLAINLVALTMVERTSLTGSGRNPLTQTLPGPANVVHFGLRNGYLGYPNPENQNKLKRELWKLQGLTEESFGTDRP